MAIIKYGNEHLWAFLIVIFVNVSFFNHMIFSSKIIELPAVKVLMKKDETIIINTGIKSNKKDSNTDLGNLPGLQMVYVDGDVLSVANYFKMLPVILNKQKVPVYKINIRDNSYTRIKQENLIGYSPRARKVSNNIFEDYLKNINKEENENLQEFSTVLLVPKDIESKFVEKERKILSKHGLENDDVLYLKGHYLRNNSGYEIELDKAVLKNGKQINFNI